MKTGLLSLMRAKAAPSIYSTLPHRFVPFSSF
jgi:hypothetical protein